MEKKIMPPRDLRKLQLIELDILLEVDRICRKHNICYNLSAGTLLGAVRHKGFIPWDDDLDIRMMRPEYDRFCKVCETEMDTSRFFLQNDRTDPEYRWGYAKVRRKGTEYLRAGQEAIKCFSGVSIDIFVVDHIPDNKLLRFLYQVIRRACIKTLWSVVGVTQDKNPLKRLLYRGLRHVNKRIPLGIMEWVGRWSEGKDTEYLVITGFYRKNYYTGRSHPGAPAFWFKEQVELEFEGFPFYACKEYDEYLKVKYGNYWESPPESLRYIHPPSSYSLDVDLDLRGRDAEAYMNGTPKTEEQGRKENG